MEGNTPILINRGLLIRGQHYPCDLYLGLPCHFCRGSGDFVLLVSDFPRDVARFGQFSPRLPLKSGEPNKFSGCRWRPQTRRNRTSKLRKSKWAVLRSPAKSLTFSGLHGNPTTTHKKAEKAKEADGWEPPSLEQPLGRCSVSFLPLFVEPSLGVLRGPLGYDFACWLFMGKSTTDLAKLSP